MKKQYTKPELDVVDFHVSNLIATSTDVPISEGYETGTTEAPRHRGIIWDED